MTKPWEETWALEPSEIGDVLDVGEDSAGYPIQVHGRWSDEQQRLASAAPDMARALLAVEWAAHMGGGGCPSCWERMVKGHSRDCALDGALRKAGIR